MNYDILIKIKKWCNIIIGDVKMLNKLMIAGIIFVILIILIIVLIVVSKNKNKNKANNEPEASILDVDEVGVPNTSELKDFSYGYEKEETIVMNPITENNIENEEEKNNKEESEDNE